MYIGSEIPAGYVARAIHGFVEELVVNDDPEYQVRAQKKSVICIILLD